MFGIGGSPLENRFVKIFTLVLIVGIAYCRRDILNDILQSSVADNNRLGFDDQQIVVQGDSLRISANMPFIRTVEYHFNAYDAPFIAYVAHPNVNMPISFCGAEVEVLFQNATLDVVDKVGAEVNANRGGRIKILSGQGLNDGLDMFLALKNEIPYARQGDIIYACRKSFGIPGDTFAPKDIICHSVKIVKVLPQASVQPVKMSFIRPGAMPKTRCGDVVSVKYRALDHNGKTYDSGFIENIEIGRGSLPVQVEQALLRIGVNGEVVLKMSSDRVEFVTLAEHVPGAPVAPRYLAHLYSLLPSGSNEESTLIIRRTA